MRNRKSYRVCRCTPHEGIIQLETRLLIQMINSQIHPIRCASTCARKAHKGLLLGDLCEKTRHPMWALKIWKFTLNEIHWKDYNDWIDVYFNTNYVRLGDVISDGICEIIGRRMDEVERRLGLSDAHGRDSWAYRAGDGWYESLYYEKYDECWDEWRDYYLDLRNEAVSRQNAEQTFSEGQSGVTPLCSQEFFGYWNDYDYTKQNLYFKIDDWDS